jgi:hypothetical protein
MAWAEGELERDAIQDELPPLHVYGDEFRAAALASQSRAPSEPVAKGDAVQPPPGKALAWNDLIGKEPPERQWIIPYWVPASHVTLLAGKGGIGKSLLAQHIGTALAVGAGYIEPLNPIKVLMWASEDDADELWRRQLAISNALEAPLDQLSHFTLRSCVGSDVTLAAPVFNALTQTPLLATLKQEVSDLGVDLVILDNVARIFGGNENDRHQVTTFIAWLQAACAPAAVLLLGHPAKNVLSEFSGSSAWEGAVRARLYFSDKPPDEDEDEDAVVDPTARYLSRRKANYSELDMRKFTLIEGVLMPDQPTRGSTRRGPSGDYVKDIVRRAIQRLATRGIFGTSSTASPQYLPKLAKQYSLMEDASESAFVHAMRAMVMDGSLEIAKVGAYSNRTPKMGLVVPAAQMDRTNGD